MQRGKLCCQGVKKDARGVRGQKLPRVLKWVQKRVKMI